MASVPARVAGSMRMQESIVNVLGVRGAVALVSSALFVCVGAASAQSVAPVADAAQGGQVAAPLQLEVPTQPVKATPPAEASDNAIVDAQDSAASAERGRGPEVHGSITAGIGYSKGYGTTTMQAADFDISGQSEGGREYDMRIHLEQSKGPGLEPYFGTR